MRIAVLHLSDFHVCDGAQFLQQKINGVLDSLNVLGDIDDYIVVFSGDLSNSGQVNEFKQSRGLIGKLIHGIKQKNNNRFVDFFMVPGNHDMCIPQDARTREYIQEHYDNETIEELIPEERLYLSNYYSHAYANGIDPYEIFFNRKYCEFEGYKIQFNLINTALFSTLEPNDKELHYFPNNKMNGLRRVKDVNICITVMHHSWEWFNWKCKTNLAKTIVDNSEFLLYGHEHNEQTSSLSIDNGLDTWISAAGKMNFSSVEEEDSFNIIVIDTEMNFFDGYIFNWNKKASIYMHRKIVSQRSLQNHSAKLMPLPSFVKNVKKDIYNRAEDFTEYFVFPKLVTEQPGNYGKKKTIATLEEAKEILYKKKRLVISGTTNSGKTTLLKYLYCSLMNEQVPLFYSVDDKQKVGTRKFVEHLFEEQYGDDSVLFERYRQLDREKRVLIIDSWDLLSIKSQMAIMPQIEEFFGFIIISSNNCYCDLAEQVKERIEGKFRYFELHIKPFFSEKRNQLVRNICMQKNTYNDDAINNVNRLIDSLVENNNGIFSLNPAFIVRYTNWFINDSCQDYTRGEAVFSKIFEAELVQAIVKFAKEKDVDELFTVFEEIAGYMYKNKKDELLPEEVRKIIELYNRDYGENVSVKKVVETGRKAKLFRETDELSIYFTNKKYLAYFIAKYLIREFQSEPSDISGINYAVENICFGINADIVLFISYILNDTRLLTAISLYAGKLLQPWDAISFSDKNISMLHNIPFEQIKPPTEDEKTKYEAIKEKNEEQNYSEEIIEARGLFNYDDKEIDKYHYSLIRAVKYTEMICKALPAFHSKLKLAQKNELVESIYLYPRKIVFAMLRPFDMSLEEICRNILEFAEIHGNKKKNGQKYTREDIVNMLNDTARAIMLSMFDHFSELATNSKTVNLLVNRNVNDMSENIERLLMLENNRDTDRLIKEAEELLRKYEGTEYEIMIKLIVRKHLFVNKELKVNRKNQIIDKIFGEGYRKHFLINKT